MDISIVILSAGKGTRMKSQKAKVLHEILGKPMLYYSIREAKKISDDITVVVAHQSEQVKEEITKYFPNINFLHQDTTYEGTGGAVRDFRPKAKKTIILNGDMPLIQANDLEKFLEIVDTDLVLGTIELENPIGYGRVILENGKVTKIIEEKDCSEQERKIKTVNGGVYFVNSNFLRSAVMKLENNNNQNEYYLTDIVEIANREGKIVKSLNFPKESLMGVNSKLDLSKAEEIFLNRIREKAMRNGVTIHLPNTVYISDEVEFIGESEIEQNVTIIGKSVIENSKILANSVIENSKIVNSTIGVMAHIRPNSKIENSKIGNFVEVKKSQLNGVKAGHLSYLGDAEIGNGTNIGAGVITANYDGKNKFQTKIGENVFVGSDSQLIAPVKIPNNCIIGAGTTVTKNVKIKENSLIISEKKLRKMKIK